MSEQNAATLTIRSHPPDYPRSAYGVVACYELPGRVQPPDVKLRILLSRSSDAAVCWQEAGTASHPVCISVAKPANGDTLSVFAEAYQLAEAGEVLLATSKPITLSWPTWE